MEERERSRHTDRATGVRVAQGSQRFRESRWLIVWVSCLLLSLGGSPAFGERMQSVSPTPPQPQWWANVTASYIAVAFWTYWPIPEPHFGAFFQGPWRHNPHDLGPGGDPATCSSSAGCISNWNWWGADRNVLLLPKGRWLATEPPWGPKWQPSNYSARVWFD
jgi:hypothetical protein